jgi:zinc protease
MQDVREKRGLAYDVHSYFAPRKLAGPFEIGLQTKREQAGESLAVVEATLAKFLRDGPDAAELQAAKQNLADGFALRLDSNAKLLGNVAMVGFYGLPLTWIDDYPRNVQAVTAAQIRAAFARHLDPQHLVTVIVAGE